MDGVPHRLALQLVKIKARVHQILQCHGIFQRVEPDSHPSLEPEVDFRRSASFEQLLQALVPKAPDHAQV
jgi:hypothetical protein